ncbi:MAG: adenylate/guanylate cyclase domain-containing protein [Pseudomonadota bacterium]
MKAADRRAIMDWIVEEALDNGDQRRLLDGVCTRLRRAGVPVARANLSQPTLHPVIEGYLFIWRGPGDVVQDGWLRERDIPADGGLNSVPFAYLSISGAPELREELHRLTGPSRFPLLEEFRRGGATDYLALQRRFGEGAGLGTADRLICSWLTRRPGGFTEAHLKDLRAIFPTLALAAQRDGARVAFETIVTTYLGDAAGQRVMTGAVGRGQGDSLRAALWYCDLRGFTKISDALPRAELLSLLHAYFDTMVSAVQRHGGDVLKFTGDGFLAQFSDLGSDEDTCHAALDAADAMRDGCEALSARRAAEGSVQAGYGLGLHFGDVAFGNVGAQARLDFTVIGAAVNEVSRIEAMSRALDQEIVISSAFRDALGPDGPDRLVSLGRYALRGVRRPQELFTLLRREHR